ncbi:hypothetical protein M3Y94_00844000 [Aphelenchoides besseyi]|nr:hypothetical protein M3Y94_00844000 [Aphelenchoides besseyi]KAI6226895.1 hypothetical protein M3Y95_00669600 [Aphelenchoides besseyi]
MRVTRSKRKAAEVKESEENSPPKRLVSSTSPKLSIQNENSSEGLGTSITLRSSRQRKATKKLEESYNMGLSSLIGTALSVTNVSKSAKPKQKEVVGDKRRSQPEAKKTDGTLKHKKSNDIGKLANGKEAKTPKIIRGELYSCNASVRVKTEPVDEEANEDHKSSASSTISIKEKTTELPAPIRIIPKPPEIVPECFKISDDYRSLSSRNSSQILKSIRRECPKAIGPVNLDRIETHQVPEVLNSLMDEMFTMKFPRPEVHHDFQVLQGAVLKHTPGLFADFMDILRETHEYMMHQTFVDESDDDISTSDIKKELADLKLNLIQDEKTYAKKRKN